MISLAGLFLTGIDVFSGMAVGAIGVVGIPVLGSVTVLPALLAWLGRRVDRGRLPLIGRRRTAARRSRLWDALVRRVVRRPALLGGAATIALLALAAPALGMRTGDPGLDDLPASTPVIQSLRHIEQAFPGGPDPAKVVVTGDRLDRPEVRQAVGALRAYAAGSGGALHEPITAVAAASGRVLVVSVPLAGSGTDHASTQALQTLRERALPTTLGKVDGISYAVTGRTADNHDFAAALHTRAPIVFGFVLALAFLLLVVAFRSLTIPLVSIVLNLLLAPAPVAALATRSAARGTRPGADPPGDARPGRLTAHRARPRRPAGRGRGPGRGGARQRLSDQQGADYRRRHVPPLSAGCAGVSRWPGPPGRGGRSRPGGAGGPSPPCACGCRPGPR
jgi:RND superfamily putative drug exporter